MGDWQAVFKDALEYRTEIVKSVLQEKGLSAVSINKTVSLHQPLGLYEVLVPADHVLRAIKIINEEIKFE